MSVISTAEILLMLTVTLFSLFSHFPMAKFKRLFTFLPFFFLIFLLIGVELEHAVGGSCAKHHQKKQVPTKLFVFGDSYADTGNTRKAVSNSWADPYGKSFPGKPIGRFSDGRVLTDYLAKFMRLKSPIPYKWRNVAPNRMRSGINFAYGGTGVFDTIYPGPNMTAQIEFFDNLINGSVYKKQELKSSLVLVILCGNDYGSYLAKGGSLEAIPTFINLVVNQLTADLQRLGNTGVKKVAVTALQPLGCLPRSTTVNSFKQCIESENSAVNYHNKLLHEAIAKLNSKSKGSPFVVLDLYGSFTIGLISHGLKLGNSGSPLKPCCVGISSQYSCGSLDKNRTKMYTVCSDPDSAFFWDMVHPTQAGWQTVYLALKASLEQNLIN